MHKFMKGTNYFSVRKEHGGGVLVLLVITTMLVV